MAGTDKSRSVYRGLLLMDPRITGIVASGDATYATSYTQAGEAFDTPVAAALTDDLVLKSSGSPDTTAPGQTFTVTTNKAGFPGRDKAAFIWERATDASPFGWEHPNVATDWESLAYSDGSTYPGTIREPDAVTLSDGTVIVCCGAEISAGTFGIITYKRNPATGTWGSPVTVVTGTSDAHPCMVVLPDDRVLLFYWVVDSASSTRNVRAYSTSDAAATWDVHSRYVLETALSTGTYTFGTRVGRLRAAYLNGDIALFGWVESGGGPTHDVLQWASADLGASASLVATYGGAMYPDVTTADGALIVALGQTTGDQGIDTFRLGSAFQPLSSAAIVALNPDTADDWFNSSGSNAAGDCTIWADEDGSVYVAHLIYSGANKEGLLWRSYDAGQTWEHVGQSALGATCGTFYRTTDTTPSYPTGLAGTHCRGSQVLLHNWIAPVGDEDNSLAALWLGGFTTVTHPFHVSFKYHASEVAWSEMWLPFELPSDTSVWTRTATGTEQLIAGAVVATTVAQTNYYNTAPTSTPAQGLAVQFELQCSIGGSTTSEFVAGRAIIGDNNHGFGLSVRCSTTGFRVYDHFAGTALGAGVTTVDMMTQWVQFRVYIASPSAGAVGYAVYYRANTKPGAPRAWTLVVSGTGLTDAGVLTATAIRWGHLSNTTSISRWRQVFFAAGSDTGRITDHAQSGGQAAGDLNGHDYAPVAISVADGLKVHAAAGPTILDSEWTIAPRYEYAIEKILPSVEPSPSEGWRSTSDGATQSITLELSAFGDTEPLNDTIGLYIQGHNWSVGALQKFDGGAWSDILSFDLRAESGLSSLRYINNKGALRAGTGTQAGTHYFQANELVGGVVRFEGASLRRRIVGNTEGFWQGTATGVTKQCTIWFEEDGTEAASGTDLAIVPPQALLLFQLAGINFQAYRLRIITGTGTPEGYFTLNKLVLGPVTIFGKDSDWGRKYGLGMLTDIIENANGNRRSRKMNRPRRSVELPWTDGIDQTQVQGSGAAGVADYLLGTSTSGGLAVALRNDTAYQLEGVLDYTGGGHIPVVYCPKITKGTPDYQLHVLRRLSMYGRIVSDFSAEVVVGDEEVDELVRVAGLVIEEER